MKKLTGLFASLVLIASLITGCAQNSGSTSQISSAGSDIVPAQSGDASTSSEEDTSEWPRTYVDKLGREVTIEKQPERIAVTYLPYWEYLIALELPPVAAVSAENYNNTWEPFLTTDYGTDKVIDLGNKVNKEKLLEVQPDLILAASDEGIEELEKIAPVIVLDGQVKMDWKYGIREIAKVVGKEDTAEARIEATEERLAEYREKLQAQYQDETVMLISVMGKDSYHSARRPAFYDREIGLGLNAPEGYPETNQYEQVTLEGIAQMNPDYIFLAVFDGDEAIVEELESNSVWQSLTAVKNNHVIKLDGAAHSPSILATEYTVEQVVNSLLQD